MAAWLRACWLLAFHCPFLATFAVLGVTVTQATSTAGLDNLVRTRKTTAGALQRYLQPLDGFVKSLVAQPYERFTRGGLGCWDMVALLAACSVVQAYRLWKQRSREDAGQPVRARGSVEKLRSSTDTPRRSTQFDPASTDPGLLRKHSTFRSYTTSVATYPSIRVFYRPHPQADKLPNKPTPLPLLVFVHGLGGSLAQFHPLLTSLVNVAPCLGIDLPGCGLSQFSPQSWEAYSVEALAELVRVIVMEQCDINAGQEVVLIGHSMGCSLSALLSSQISPIHKQVNFDIIGQIAICPKASRPSYKQVLGFRKLLNIPTPIFDLWRRWDRRGGTESASVTRFVGHKSDLETKKLQEKFNAQSQTAVWRRMASGAVPHPLPGERLEGGLPGPEIWAGISLPLYLIAGEADDITKSEEIAVISTALGKAVGGPPTSNAKSKETVSQTAASEVEVPPSNNPNSINHDETCGQRASSTETTLVERNGSTQSSRSTRFSEKKIVLKTSILPSPANHALLYDQATYRTLAGLIQSFLADHIDARLSLGWQLQHLSTEGKWDVKNLAKWQAVKPVSEPIADVFRAMKTLREIDETHSPSIFVQEWKDKLKAVIDISHESPVYDPRKLDEGGVEYHKFPTVSKIPPTPEEVKDFIALVDRIRTASSHEDPRLIGVHCHYGFNRTGFFICSYLIEREGFSVQRAIDEFQAKRPPGIRHDHFIDTLFVRYCVGLKRAPTL